MSGFLFLMITNMASSIGKENANWRFDIVWTVKVANKLAEPQMLLSCSKVKKYENDPTKNVKKRYRNTNTGVSFIFLARMINNAVKIKNQTTGNILK